MPIYEYRCKKCNHIFEEIQNIGEGSENLTCPVCNEPQPEKILSCCNSIGGSNSPSFDSAPASPSCGSGGFS
jgi:putative FmdB family regulatory protein